MKKWNFTIITCVAILCASLVSSFSQDTTSSAQIDSIEISIKFKEKDVEEFARSLDSLIKKMRTNITTEIEEEIVRKLKEGLIELEKEISALNKELADEKEEERQERDEYESGDDCKGSYGLDIRFNKKKSKLSNVQTRWILADLGFASYIAPDPLPEINGVNPMDPSMISSVSWRLHIMNQRINVVRHHVNFLYGAGFSFNSYGFSNPSTLIPYSPQVNFDLPDDYDFSFKKNKLRATYLHIPLMINFESNPYQNSKSLHVNAGVYGNILLKAKTVQKSRQGKIKNKDNFNLNTFQYGLMANIGYGPVTFYGSYGLNELFKAEKDNGYRVHPITFGVKLLPF